MRVSAVITTTGARPALLSRALASVRAQTRSASEILLVVDGAPERVEPGTGVRCLEIPAPSRGASAARNLGAAEASGEHVAFLDDDDAWKPRYLERAFERGADLDVALTAFEKHNARGVALEKVPPEELRPASFLVRNPGLRGSNLIIRRDVYASIGGFDVTLPAFNDLDFGFRLSSAGAWRYRRVVEPLVEFHAHEGARLSTPGCASNREGMARFWARYAPVMSFEERATFRDRARRLWGNDPAAGEWASLLRAATEWARSLPRQVTWLLGPPGAGKTTWMRALAEAVPALEQLELAAVLPRELRFDGRTPGGATLVAAEVERLRASWRSREPIARVVSATSLPSVCLPIDPARERIVVLRPAVRALELQRRSRPLARPAAVELAERERLDAWHAGLRVSHDVLTPPFLPSLLGGAS